MHRSRLAILAEAWLAAGATSFSVWNEQRSLAVWPRDRGHGYSDHSLQPSKLPAHPSAHSDVSGVFDNAAEARLKADASLLGDLASIESELDNMTGELIERQDQLLALYDLTQSTRSHLACQRHASGTRTRGTPT